MFNISQSFSVCASRSQLYHTGTSVLGREAAVWPMAPWPHAKGLLKTCTLFPRVPSPIWPLSSFPLLCLPMFSHFLLFSSFWLLWSQSWPAPLPPTPWITWETFRLLLLTFLFWFFSTPLLSYFSHPFSACVPSVRFLTLNLRRSFNSFRIQFKIPGNSE